jgi:hypothetical protein
MGRPDARREDRRGDVADRQVGRLEHRPDEVRAAMAQGQPDERTGENGISDSKVAPRPKVKQLRGDPERHHYGIGVEP